MSLMLCTFRPFGIKRLYVVMHLEAEYSIALAVECTIISLQSVIIYFLIFVFSVCCSVITPFKLLVTHIYMHIT